MQQRSHSEIWVGLTVVAAIAIFLYATFRIGSCGLLQPEGRRLIARFNDASGVELRTAVTIAGVRVGEVEAVDLEEGRARLRLRIDDPEAQIPVDSRVAIRSRGLLGERLIEITPGPSERILEDGGVLTWTVDAPSVDRLLDRLADVADDVKAVTESLRVVLGGPEGEAAIAETVENIRVASRELRGFLQDNRGRFEGIVENLEGFSAEINRMVEDNGQTVDELLASFRTTADQLQQAMVDVSEATGRVSRGEGTLGKLVQDEALYEEARTTLDELRTALREVRKAAEEAQEQLPVTVLGTVVGTLF